MLCQTVHIPVFVLLLCMQANVLFQGVSKVKGSVFALRKILCNILMSEVEKSEGRG